MAQHEGEIDNRNLKPIVEQAQMQEARETLRSLHENPDANPPAGYVFEQLDVRAVRQRDNELKPTKETVEE